MAASLCCQASTTQESWDAYRQYFTGAMTMTAAEAQPKNRCLLSPSGAFFTVWLVGGTCWFLRWLELLALGIYTYILTGSELAVTAVIMVRFLPFVLIGGAMGKLALRWDPCWLLILGLTGLATTSLWISALAFLGKAGLWQIAVGSAVWGIYWTMEFPVRRALIGDVVEIDQIGSAMALDTVAQHITRIIGPFMGGVLMQLFGLGTVFALSALLYALCGLMLLQRRHHINMQRRRSTSVETNYMSFRQAWRCILATQSIAQVLCATLIINLFILPYFTMIPAIGMDVLRANNLWLGILQASEGAGALVAALLVTSLSRTFSYDTLFVAGTLTIILAVFAFSVSASYWLSALLLFAVGLGIGLFAAMQSTVVYTTATDHTRTIAMSGLTVCIGTMPFGMLLLGALSELVGPARGLTIFAGLAGLGITICQVVGRKSSV